MNYRELNEYVSNHTSQGDVCGSKLRSWRQMGDDLAIVDLRKAYLQIKVDPSLWKHQVVEHNGQKYCLTRLGFGLKVAPKIMTAIVNKVLSMDSSIRAGTDSYIDDIVVNTKIISCDTVINHLKRLGLEAKEPESAEGSRILGLRLERQSGELIWKWDNIVDSTEGIKTRRQLFAWCGQMIGHFPVAGWLHPACSYIKRMMNEVDLDGQIEIVHDRECTKANSYVR